MPEVMAVRLSTPRPSGDQHVAAIRTRQEPQDFTVGERVEMHPASDLWMRGARFGTVEKVGRTRVTVRLDRLPRPLRVDPELLTHA